MIEADQIEEFLDGCLVTSPELRKAARIVLKAMLEAAHAKGMLEGGQKMAERALAVAEGLA